MWRRSQFPPPPQVAPVDQDRLERQREESTAALLDAVHRGPEVRRVSSEMNRLRVRNGFEDLIESAMERRRHAR